MLFRSELMERSGREDADVDPQMFDWPIPWGADDDACMQVSPFPEYSSLLDALAYFSAGEMEEGRLHT